MIIYVKVVPKSKKPEVTKLDENKFKIKVDAVAEDGKANQRLIEIISGYFNVRKSSVSIIRGLKGRNKIIEIKP